MVGYRLNSDINETDVAEVLAAEVRGRRHVRPRGELEHEPLRRPSSSSTPTPRTTRRPCARTAGTDRTVNVTQHDILFNGLYLFNTGSDKFQPFLLGGLGASILAPDGSLDSVTNFAFTLGGGFKYYASDRFGIRGDVRWMPQYLYSTDGGTWCDPFYGCYYYPNDHILTQWDFKLGAIIRF